jgi:hypothetical protein
MTSASQRKGDQFERDVVTYLRTVGLPVERTRAGWVDDRGDIQGIEWFTFECKNVTKLDLAGWVQELLSECANAGTSLGAVVHKRRGTTDPASHYATMPLSMLADLLNLQRTTR